MNNYFSNLIKNASHLTPHLSYQAKQEAEYLSKLGINSQQQHKDYFYLNLYIRKIAESSLKRKISEQEKQQLLKNSFENLQNYPINTLKNLVKSIRNSIKTLSLTKQAYPMGQNVNQYPQHARDLNKWFATYRQVAQGANLNQLTQSWDPNEKQDYLQWAKFYQEGDHLKYKMAQLSVDQLQMHLPNVQKFGPDLNTFNQTPDSDELIRQQINSVLGRLNSAEKLVTSKYPNLRIILGKGYESWLSKLHELKRQIQIAPLKNAKSPLLVDLIYKHANQLQDLSAKNLMLKLAQAEEMLLNFDLILNKFAQVAALPTSPEEKGDAMEEFVLNLNGENIPEIQNQKDKQKIDDQDQIEIPKNDKDDDQIVVEAQVAPQPANQPIQPPDLQPKPQPIKTEAPDTNDLIERALAHVTVADVVNKLEALSNIFKNREIARQLNFIDMMLDKLGIAAFFPALAEASRSALESNQYCQTRIEDILAKIRGAMIVPSDDKIELEQSPQITSLNPNTPELNTIKNKLNKDKETEQAVREKKKQEEQAKILAPEPTETLQTAPELQQASPIPQIGQPNRM